jgi:hypothetical protein
MPLQVLAKLKPKPRQWYLLRPKAQVRPKGAGKAPLARRAMAGLNAMVAVVGIIGLVLFGFLTYLSFNQGGWNTVTVVADGIGLVLSGMMVAAGLFLKMK